MMIKGVLVGQCDGKPDNCSIVVIVVIGIVIKIILFIQMEEIYVLYNVVKDIKEITF